jgi:hypothetical protein
MTGKSVTAYSSQLEEGHTTSTENISYLPTEVATAVAFMVGIYQVDVKTFPLTLKFPGGWDGLTDERKRMGKKVVIGYLKVGKCITAACA